MSLSPDSDGQGTADAEAADSSPVTWPTVRTVVSRGQTFLKVIDAGEIVLDLTMVEAFNLAIDLIEKAGTVASRMTMGTSRQ